MAKANRNNELGLHLQSDGTSPFQRSNSIPLALGSKGIDHFTNWNNKINSIASDNTPWYADEYDSSKGSPTDVDILDDMAIVSYGDYDQEQNIEIQADSLNATFSTEWAINYDIQEITFNGWYGLRMERVNNIYRALGAALNSQYVADRYGNRSLRAAEAYFDDIEISFDVESSLSGYEGWHNFKFSYGGTSRYKLTGTDENDHCYREQATIAAPDFEPKWYWVEIENEDGSIRETFITLHGEVSPTVDGAGPDVPLSYLLAYEQVKSFGLDKAPTAVQIVNLFGHIQSNPRSYACEQNPEQENVKTYARYGSVSTRQSSSNDGKVYNLKATKKLTFTDAGKVEIYQRKRGFITAISGNEITTSSQELQNGDIIKISSALSTSKQTSPMNGIKYVKKGSDGKIYIYDDVNFIEETDTSDVRTSDGITWTAFGNKDKSDSPLALNKGETWELVQSLSSPMDLSEVYTTSNADLDSQYSWNGYAKTYEPKVTSSHVTGVDVLNENGLIYHNDDLYGGFKFGCDADIKKLSTDSTGVSKYVLVVGERGLETNSIGHFDDTVDSEFYIPANTPFTGRSGPFSKGLPFTGGGSSPGDQEGGYGNIDTGGLDSGSAASEDEDPGEDPGDYMPDPFDDDYGGDEDSGGDDVDDEPEGRKEYQYEDGIWYQTKRARPLPDFFPHGRIHIYHIYKDRYGAITSMERVDTLDASSYDPEINNPHFTDLDAHSDFEENYETPNLACKKGFNSTTNWFSDYGMLDPRNLYWYKAALSCSINDHSSGMDATAVFQKSAIYGDYKSSASTVGRNRIRRLPSRPVQLYESTGEYQNSESFRLANNTERYIYSAAEISTFNSGGTDFVVRYNYSNMSNSYCFLDSFGKSVAVDVVDGEAVYFAASSVKTHITEIHPASTEVLECKRQHYLGKGIDGSRNLEFIEQNMTSIDNPLLIQASVGYIHSFGKVNSAMGVYIKDGVASPGVNITGFTGSHVKIDRISNTLDEHLPRATCPDFSTSSGVKYGNYYNYDENGKVSVYTEHDNRTVDHHFAPVLHAKMASWANSLCAKDNLLIFGQPTITASAEAASLAPDAIMFDYGIRPKQSLRNRNRGLVTVNSAVIISGDNVRPENFDKDPSSIYMYEVVRDYTTEPVGYNYAGNVGGASGSFGFGYGELGWRGSLGTPPGVDPKCVATSSGYVPRWKVNSALLGFDPRWVQEFSLGRFVAQSPVTGYRRYELKQSLQHSLSAIDSKENTKSDGEVGLMSSVRTDSVTGTEGEDMSGYDKLPHSRKNTFGYNIKYSDGIVLTNAFSFYNTVGNTISSSDFYQSTESAMLRNKDNMGIDGNLLTSLSVGKSAPYQDYVFVIEKGKYGFSTIMTLAPSEKSGYGRAIGDITYDNDTANSYTKKIMLKNRYDTFDKKVILDDGVGYSVFDRNTVAKKLSIENSTLKTPLEHYFIFNEVMRGNQPQPGSTNYNLSNIYKSNFDSSRGFGESIRLKTNNDGNNSYMYFFKVPLSNENLRVLESIDIEFQVDNVIAFRNGQDVDVSKDSAAYLPAVGLYKGDIRETIRQRGDIGDFVLEFGENNAGIDKGKLYEGGTLDEWMDTGELGTALHTQDHDYSKIVSAAGTKSSTVKDATYIDNSVLNPTFTGTVTLSKSDLAAYVDYNDLTKSNYTRRFLNNYLGTGTVGVQSNSYEWTLDDSEKEAYDSSIANIQATLAIAFANKAAFDDGANAYKGSLGNAFGDGSTYFIENEVRIKSVTLKYKDEDFAVFRPFVCSFFETHNVAISLDEPETLDNNPIIRLGRSQTAAYFDEEEQILTGTFSNSIQVLHMPQNGTMRNIDIHQPEALNLHMISYPSDSGIAPLYTRGHVTETGGRPLMTEGVNFKQQGMTLKCGPVPITGSIPLSIPEVLGFDCSGMPLYCAPFGGLTETKTNSLYIGPKGGTEVLSTDLGMAIGNVSETGVLDLAIAGGLGSGNINLAIPSGYGIHNSIACVSPHLYIEGALTHYYFPFHLSIGQEASTGTMPLFMSSPQIASGDMSLFAATSLTGIMPLSTTSVGTSAGSTTLWVGKKAAEKTMPLSMHFSRHSDAMTLFTKKSTNPTNSLDDNGGASCIFSRRETLFDISSNAESTIAQTTTNSISRDRLLDDVNGSNDFGYGLQRRSNVGGQITSYTPKISSIFFTDIVSRESFDSNGTYFAIGVNSNKNIGSSNDSRTLQIFEISEGDQVKLSHNYEDITNDISSIDLEITPDKVYYKSVRISGQNRIAISVRVEGASIIDPTVRKTQDVIVIIKKQDITTTTTVVEEGEECSFTDFITTTTTSTENKWASEYVFASAAATSEDQIADIDLGSSLEWSSETLYYNKQTTEFGKICSRSYNDSFATETEAADFKDTVDYNGYKNNISFMDAGTKTAFGNKIRIYDNLMLVSAPLADPYISRKSLTRFEAASPRGAVYVFTQSNGNWSYVSTLYKGGYTDTNVSTQFECGYEASLFGYDFDYNSDSNIIVVGEPLSKKVYTFEVKDNGTSSLIKTYTGTSTQTNFGSFVALCNKTNPVTFSRGTAGTIHNLFSGQDFNFPVEEITNELFDYLPRETVLRSESETVSAIRGLTFYSGHKILVARDFSYRFGTAGRSKLQKFSLLDVSKISNPLYVSGPIQDTGTISLQIPSVIDTNANAMNITLPVIGQTGSMPLHMHNATITGTMPLHLRTDTLSTTTLALFANYDQLAANTTLYLDTMTGNSSAANLAIGKANAPKTHQTEIFILGEIGTASIMPLRLGKDPVKTTVGSGVVGFIEGNLADGTRELTKTNTIFVSGNYVGVGDQPLVMNAPTHVEVSGINTLYLSSPAGSGVVASGANLSLQNTQTSLPAGSTVGGIIGRTGISLFMNAWASGTQTMDLTLFRRGIGGGEELDSSMGAVVYNQGASLNTDIFVSGSLSENIGSMNLGLFDLSSTGNPPLFVRGYTT
jgi:hypothetical protein